jgi:hypothetical protein
VEEERRIVEEMERRRVAKIRVSKRRANHCMSAVSESMWCGVAGGRGGGGGPRGFEAAVRGRHSRAAEGQSCMSDEAQAV